MEKFFNSQYCFFNFNFWNIFHIKTQVSRRYNFKNEINTIAFSIR
jgi:hypothetical protein